jgi:hypothetical protein
MRLEPNHIAPLPYHHRKRTPRRHTRRMKRATRRRNKAFGRNSSVGSRLGASLVIEHIWIPGNNFGQFGAIRSWKVSLIMLRCVMSDAESNVGSPSALGIFVYAYGLLRVLFRRDLGRVCKDLYYIVSLSIFGIIQRKKCLHNPKSNIHVDREQ